MEKEKAILRVEMLEQLKSLPTIEYNEMSLAIKENFIHSSEFINSSIIGITISRFPEVDTKPIIEAAWALGKSIAVPKCDRITRGMDFRIITSYAQLEEVYMDLQEPITSITNSVNKIDIDLQVVPGVVFSDNGYRIGFGGGYYDRYLHDFSGDTISLAFEVQTAHTVLFEDHDIPVPKVFTENGIISSKKGENSQ